MLIAGSKSNQARIQECMVVVEEYIYMGFRGYIYIYVYVCICICICICICMCIYIYTYMYRVPGIIL